MDLEFIPLPKKLENIEDSKIFKTKLKEILVEKSFTQLMTLFHITLLFLKYLNEFFKNTVAV